MDALSDVLRVARLTGGVFLHADFTAPWCLAAQVSPEYCSPFLGPTAHIVFYHYVLEGQLNVQVGNEAPFELNAGEVVLFPRNDFHLMGSDLDLPPRPAAEVIRAPDGDGLAAIEMGGGGAPTKLICGFLGCAKADGNPIFNTLPRALRLKIEQDGASEWIRSTFQYAADEVANGRAGSETVLAKMSELLFVEAVRQYADNLPPDQTGWLNGLKDQYVSRALAFIHNAVGRDWSVEELGREVGLSRSAFADRFTKIIGSTPKQYITKWRMQVAAQELRSTPASLAEISVNVGYESEAAFTRAFKREFGSPPGTWRREN